MNNKSIEMKRLNGQGEYDSLYPKTLSTNTIISDTLANEMGVSNGATVDEVLNRVQSLLFDSKKGYLKINAKYASSGNPAKDVYFRGISNVDESLMKTNDKGVFYSDVPLGIHTLVFRPIIGEQFIPNETVTISAGKLTEINISINKSDGGLIHIIESNDYLIGQDATSVDFFGIGGGGSGGISTISWDESLEYACAASGGGSGFVETANIDLFDLRGNFLRIDIGAGGQGVTIETYDSNVACIGNEGGSTTITRHDGVVILNASGGGYGEGKWTKYSSPNMAGSATAIGGDGACPGASVRAMRTLDTSTSPYTNTEKTTFTTNNIEGVYVFGNKNYPQIGGGGYAQGSTRWDDKNIYTSIYGVGCKEDGSTIDGTGAGSGGLIDTSAKSHSFFSTHSGGSGCVFIK